MQTKTFGQRDIIRRNRQLARQGKLPPPIPPYWRPKHRSECKDGPRPCPFVACKYHLFLDVTPKGGLRVPYGEEPDGLTQMSDTCALDIADRGPVTLESIASVQVITRERVRQIELSAIKRMEEALALVMADDDEFGPAASRALEGRPELTLPKTLADVRRRGPAPNVIDWLSEVGSPPIGD